MHQIQVWKNSSWQNATPGVTGITKRVCNVEISTARIGPRTLAELIAREISKQTGLPSRIVKEGTGVLVWSLYDPPEGGSDRNFHAQIYRSYEWVNATFMETGVADLAGYHVSPTCSWNEKDNAIRAAAELHEKLAFRSRVIKNGLVVWASEAADMWPREVSIDKLTQPEYQRETTTMATPDLNKPLTIAREALIEKLQENLDAEVAKREKAEADQAAERQEILDAIAEFTPDELFNIFRDHYSTTLTTLKFDKENKSFVTGEIQPTQKETDLEKFTRVLEMSSDENLEITPNESIYRLL